MVRRDSASEKSLVRAFLTIGQAAFGLCLLLGAPLGRAAVTRIRPLSLVTDRNVLRRRRASGCDKVTPRRNQEVATPSGATVKEAADAAPGRVGMGRCEFGTCSLAAEHEAHSLS